jgi:hypothetical protein
MLWLHDFSDDVFSAFECAKNQISEYPPDLVQKGLAYLEKYNLFNKNSTKNYVCYLLPFWLHKIFPIKKDTCKYLSIGNIFAMLYFFIQDDLFDTHVLQTDNHLLAHFFLTDFLACYLNNSLDPNKILYYFKIYLKDWSQSITQEQDGYWEKQNNNINIYNLANKTAPLKLTIASMALAADKVEMIDEVSKIVDLILIKLQLLDDWHDWRKDMEQKNCTYFLNKTMELSNIKDFSQLREIHVQKAIYHGNIIDNILLQLCELYNQTNMNNLSDYYYLHEFDHYLQQKFIQIQNTITINKKNMMKPWISQKYLVFDKIDVES